MQQVLWRIPLKFGPFPEGVPIYGFGMMLFLAFILCTWLAGRRARREGIAKEHIQDLAIWLFIGGLLGARITYLLQETPRPTFTELLTRLPKIWDGGIILYGSVLGALVGYLGAYFFIFRKYRISTLKLADIIAPSVAVGLCLGRIGCFLNGCCYGQVACADCAVYAVHFPLSAPAREALVDAGTQTVAGFTVDADQPSDLDGVKVGKVEHGSAAYDAGLRDGDVIQGVTVDGAEQRIGGPADLSRVLGSLQFWKRGAKTVSLDVRPANGAPAATKPFTPRTVGLHPTQLYEAVSMFLLFLVLTAYYPLHTRDGQVMAVLMACYGAHRFFNELLRDDPRPVGFERYSSVLLVGAGLALLAWTWLRPAQYRPQVPAKEPASVA
jgi:phosphatidylglycerol---prolipoprotein diacylglyceryl transferase